MSSIAPIRRHIRTLSIARGFRVLLAAGVVLLVVLNVVATPSSASVATGPASDAAIDAWFDAERRDAGIPGAALVVVRAGRVHAAGFGAADATGRPVTADTPFVLGSVSKGITALAVARLAEEGTLDLDAPVRTYLPGFALADAAASGAITIRELLDQTSGIPTSAGLAPLQGPVESLHVRVRELASVLPVSAPGAEYHYSNANYVVLGRLVEVVSGESYEAYLQRHVFGPLGMAHSTADRATAVADGLGDAHRLWFGLPDTHAPLDRPDLAPAGFVAASAADMGRYLAALLEPEGPGGGRVASAAAVRDLFTGVAPTGLPDERYALGWVDTTFRGERIAVHAGSTTDMASLVAVMPARGTAVAVLFDAQSPLYELLHKPDAIGLGVLALAIGQGPDGTLEGFYPVVDVVLVAIIGTMALGVVRLARAPLGRTGAAGIGPRPRRLAAILSVGALAFRAYLDVVVPAAILVGGPGLLGAGWPVLVRTDVGLVLAVIAGLRATDGVIRAARWARARRWQVSGLISAVDAR